MNRRDIIFMLVVFAALSAAGYAVHPWSDPFGNATIFHGFMLPMQVLSHLSYPLPAILQKGGAFVSAAAWTALIGLLLALSRTLRRKKEPNKAPEPTA
jgi:hypothetical protein